MRVEGWQIEVLFDTAQPSFQLADDDAEERITKLTLVKRPILGRAKVDLLEARLIGAA